MDNTTQHNTTQHNTTQHNTTQHNTTPLISVIVPVYQVEAYLEYCLNSILNQTYANFEVILVNDGSTDRSGEICQEYARKDARFKLFYQTNQGVSAARNLGLDVCKGDYITFIDSDDFVANEYLESLLQVAQGENADISLTPYHLYVDDRAVYELVYYPFEEDRDYSYFSTQESLDEIVNRKFVMTFHYIWGSLYKRKVFDNIRFPAGRMWEDEATMTKIYMQSEKLILVQTPLYFYRHRPNSIVSSPMTLKKCEDILFAMKDRLLDMFLSSDSLNLENQKSYTFERLKWIKTYLEELQETNSIAYKEVTRLLSYQK